MMYARKYLSIGLAAVALGVPVAQQESCSESVEDLEDISGDNNAKYDSKVQQLELGMTESEMKAIMGEPRDPPQVMESGYSKDVTYYYGSYQLSFENGKLRSKNRY